MIFEVGNITFGQLKLEKNKVFSMVCKVDPFFSVCVVIKLKRLQRPFFARRKKVCMFEFKNEPMEDFGEALEKKEK